ncbi:TauD/TfdA family dioxygenase [Microbulbifer sp. 2205BS26-8]|uniref:TauD/TfdA family dioxygenase n=1 Tax=Microbulbifer sp. 2205BS26-8 TaxID=3064386 RepID=UPI00273F0922|nr:TauD/TfdA family dioxygenase [Microbulbifer sp. 2205BS26-8]MDP5209826.1 TauD/TfdA family dioxygenase [Microbulbifer sp. 2205BS26-8]
MNFSNVTLTPLASNGHLPIVVEANKQSEHLYEWVQDNKDGVDTLIEQYGGIVFRGFALDGRQGFINFVGDISEPLEYRYRSTPRKHLGKNLYTSTEYPPDQVIPLHCENAYQRDWPMRLFFYCERVAKEGGETLLANIAHITHNIPQEIIQSYTDKKIMYVRNYHRGLDLPWQTVFQTENKNEVNDYCERHGIVTKWLDNNTLRTEQICQVMAKHPGNRKSLWFNQAHLFHISNLDKKIREVLLKLYSQEALPRNVLHGDGSFLDEEYLDQIRTVYDQHKALLSWQKGDVLLLDNMAIAHGRNTFSGDRSIVVIMGDSYSSQLKSPTALYTEIAQ